MVFSAKDEIRKLPKIRELVNHAAITPLAARRNDAMENRKQALQRYSGPLKFEFQSDCTLTWAVLRNSAGRLSTVHRNGSKVIWAPTRSSPRLVRAEWAKCIVPRKRARQCLPFGTNPHGRSRPSACAGELPQSLTGLEHSPRAPQSRLRSTEPWPFLWPHQLEAENSLGSRPPRQGSRRRLSPRRTSHSPSHPRAN